jgi:predicted TIM-barrel fold metal-dependent hydrolase
MTTFTRIDTHHHIMPPRWLEAAGQHIYESAMGIPVEWIRDWSPAQAIEVMDRTGIGVAVGSVATPSVAFAKGEDARRLARECNEYGAKMIADYPKRFGIFATVPMPDVQGTLREIEHSLDVLKLDGIVFMTNFGSTWPGDPGYREVFDELNRRKAIAFFHPHVLYSNQIVQPEITPAVLEYPFDSTRAIASLLYTGTFTRCREMKFIFSHGGGALPFLAGRIAALSRRPTKLAERLAERLPDGPEFELRRLFYDTPSVTNRPAMNSLLTLVPASQVLFGTDFPYMRAERNADYFDRMGFDVDEHAAISRRNAVRLMPRLAKLVAP